MTRTAKRNLTATISYLIIAAMCLFVLIPLLWMGVTSLKSIEEITLSSGLNILPEKVQWGNFVRIWDEYPMLAYLKNSLITVFSSTSITIMFASLAGYGLSRFEFGGKSAILSFLLVTQMFPAVMKLVPYYQLLQRYGLVNKLGGLVIVYTSFCLPFCTWLMMGFFKRIPLDLDEAAKIDGCGHLRTFVIIVLPLALPGIVSTAIYAFIQNWNEYMFASLLMTGETQKTLTVGIGQMVGENRTMWNDMMAASIISSIPMLAIFLFLQRYLIDGLTAGSVKE